MTPDGNSLKRWDTKKERQNMRRSVSYGSKEMNRELLEKEFEKGAIKQRKGNFGATLDYIEAHAVIQRLNDAFEGEWSFEIVYHEQMGGEVIVQGKLTAGGISKMQFGNSKVTLNKSDGETVSLGDDLKAAASDAVKKCATLFGVGLHLYRTDSKNDMSSMSSNKGNDLITDEQLAKVKELRTKLKWG